MPEYKKADTALNDYQSAWSEFRRICGEILRTGQPVEFQDTRKIYQGAIGDQEKNLSDMLIKLQGWQQQAQAAIQQKHQDLSSHSKESGRDRTGCRQGEWIYLMCSPRKPAGVSAPRGYPAAREEEAGS